MATQSVQKSTIVRIYRRAGLGLTRTAFAVLERAAPGLGARWAARRWLTLPRYRGTRRTEGVPLAETFTVPVRGRRVTGRSWGSGPTVYLVHGWGGEGSQLNAFIEPLLAGGHRVVMFDGLSHGDSEPGGLGPRRSSIPELVDAVTEVVAAQGPAHAVIAHSGGGAATFYAMRRGLSVGRLVLLAPMTRPDPYTILFSAALNFGERIRTRMLRLVAETVGVDWSEFDLPSHLGDVDPLPPLLLAHDPHDRETRYADSVAVRTVWPNARLITVRNLGHRRLLRDPDVIRETVAFVTPATESRQVS
jgi:pimeloyl-ACP methyl ester carboxylesterase